MTVTLTDANGAVHTAPTGSCTTAGANTDANGQCTITFTSNSAGTVTGHATSILSVGGSASFTIATNGTAPNSLTHSRRSSTRRRRHRRPKPKPKPKPKPHVVAHIKPKATG